MFKDGNFIGVLLVGLCLISAAIMIWATATDRELTYDGPNWLIWILAGVFLIGSFWGLFQGIRGRNKEWPNPGSGQRSLLDRIRGKNDDQPR